MATAPFTLSRQVEFRDTDAAGIMHFSVFFTFMEEAEHAFLRDLGLNIMLQDPSGPFSFPRVNASCDYKSPLRFEDTVEIAVRILRIGQKSVTYEFDFHSQGRAIALGRITAVTCRLLPNGQIGSIPLPDWVAAKLHAVGIAPTPGSGP
ncbi:MAG TPA: thioesterase family protein [Pirellulales bacterium]|jgi:YbgC/YbaW family acyl-CoA thioester hydrolase|nr:thioesterase family protein [Pirellulales bacterium]